MNTPDNIAGEMTEKIMERLAGKLNPNPVFPNLDTRTYNRAYSEVYELLTKYLIPKEQRAATAQVNTRSLPV